MRFLVVLSVALAVALAAPIEEAQDLEQKPEADLGSDASKPEEPEHPISDPIPPKELPEPIHEEPSSDPALKPEEQQPDQELPKLDDLSKPMKDPTPPPGYEPRPGDEEIEELPLDMELFLVYAAFADPDLILIDEDDSKKI